MFGVRQRIESFGKRVLFANLLRAHIRKSLPRLSRRELDANAFLHRFRAVHRNPCGGSIAQVVSPVEKRHVLPRDLRLLPPQSGENRREQLPRVLRPLCPPAPLPLPPLPPTDRPHTPPRPP